MRRVSLPLSICVIVVLIFSQDSTAQLMAHFKTTYLDYNSNAGDCDVCVLCTPTCELYFKMGVFSSNTLRGDLALYPGSCTYYELEDGIWNYTDQEISRQLPNLTTGAQFYFALFDEDPADEDDLLGSHRTSTIDHSSSGTSSNNDLIPSGHTVTSCDAGTVDDDRTSDRFNFQYYVRFTDESAPGKPATPTHYDADASPGFDNDTTLNFNWSPATDPNTGISRYEVALEEDGFVVADIYWTTTSVTVCESACDISHTIVNGSSYKLRIRAENGEVIGIENPAWSLWSEWSAAVVTDITYTIGGTVSGLASGNGVTLQNNGGDNLVVTENGGFTFPAPLVDDSAFSVTVLIQPAIPSQNCEITNGSGSVTGADVTNVSVDCVTTCQVKQISGVTEDSAVAHEACETLYLGPSFTAEDGASVFVSSGWDIEFIPEFLIQQGATLDAEVCGQSLCSTSPDPMPYGCHSCVDQICDIEPSCCGVAFDQSCLDRVSSDCGLICE